MAEKETPYAVAGMSCSHCERSIQEEVFRVPGVVDAAADHETGRLVVTGDADPEAVRAAVEEAGYEVVS